MPWIQSQIKQKDGLLTHPPFFHLHSPALSSSSSSSLPYQKESNPSSSGTGNKISPPVLFIITILTVILFISSLLYLFVRFFIKKRSFSSIFQSNRYPEMSPSNAVQRQLQQLFNLHDSGLDQAFIDALPVFNYKEVRGLKEAFDCAVCLCEFSEHDKLRLLPLCSHAFHIDCIGTWLLSNSTCPVCRGSLFTPGFSNESPVFDIEDSSEEDGSSGSGVERIPCGQKPAEDEIVGEKRVLPVRLGKFRNTNGGGGGCGGGETSSSNLDARRCYSMGSLQYVVASSNLRVALCPIIATGTDGAADVRHVKGRGGHNGNSSIDGDAEGKKIKLGSKGESFSVSKIWLWPRKGKFPSCSVTYMASSSVNASLPWSDRTLPV